MRSLLLLLTIGFSLQAQTILSAVSPPIGPFTVGAGGCLTQAVTVSGAVTTGNTASTSPRTFPGNGITWNAYISAANTVTIKVCNSISGTIGGSIYDVTVSQPGSGGGGTVTAVTASPPVTSTGGATPNIACPTCATLAGMVPAVPQQVLASPAASVTFSSIPATFSQLVLIYTASSSTAATTDDVYVQFNGDTATHYGNANMANAVTTPFGYATANTATPDIGTIGGASSILKTGGGRVDIPAYSFTTLPKSGTCQSAAANNATTNSVQTVSCSFIWSGTAAINSIKVALFSGANFITGSVFTVYGIP